MLEEFTRTGFWYVFFVTFQSLERLLIMSVPIVQLQSCYVTLLSLFKGFLILSKVFENSTKILIFQCYKDESFYDSFQTLWSSFLVFANKLNSTFQQGKFNPQYMKGSPHSSQKVGKAGRSQTPDHMLSSDQGVEMKPLHQVQTSLASNVQSPSVAQKVSRMGVPTPFAGASASVPSPIR